MQKWAEWLYKSKEWREVVRPYIIERDGGLCVRCGEPGSIVHHIIWLTPENINDPLIAFGEDNLELVCEKCHGAEHEGELSTDSDLTFDESGDLVPIRKEAPQ